MAANHSDSKLKMNPRFWAFCVGRVLWNWTQTDWMEMRLSSQVGGIPVTRVSYGRGGAGLTKLSMPLPVHSRNAAIFLGLIYTCGNRIGRRRSRKVFVRALETFLPQSFELLITATTIILRLQFENTQKAITLLGNLCSENIPWQSQIVSANHLFPPSVWRENDRIRARRNSDQAATEKEAMKRWNWK